MLRMMDFPHAEREGYFGTIKKGRQKKSLRCVLNKDHFDATVEDDAVGFGIASGCDDIETRLGKITTMNKNYTSRKFLLDMVCQKASIYLESAVRKIAAFSNTIGGPSRGVLLVGGLRKGVFEKSTVCAGGEKSCGSTKNGSAATQVGADAGGYGNVVGGEKILTLGSDISSDATTGRGFTVSTLRLKSIA
jgi:hypothetical protein